ncbi:MAG: hypothetical protein ACK5N8_00870 [Alphaproteobacteria bacterium]
MSENNKKHINDKNPRIGTFGRLLGGALSANDTDAIERYINKKDKATQNDLDMALERAKSINPYYDDYKDQEYQDQGMSWKDRMLKKFKLNNNKHEDILYKKNKDITEQEIKDTSKYTWFESKDKSLNQKLNDKVSSWNDEIYGKGSSVDAAGRQNSPTAKVSLLAEPINAKTKDGLSFGEGFDKISTAMSSKNSDVSSLQTGLNNSYGYSPTLKVDGDLGPKTTSRTKEAMFDFGVSDVVNKIFG